MKTFYKKELKTVMAIFALAFGLLLTNTAQAQSTSTTIVLGSVSACDSWTAPWDLTGATVLTTSTTTSGTNVATDTTWTVALTVLASSSSAHTEDACDSYTVPSGDTTFSVVGTHTYTDVIPNAEGCDSTISLTVNISTGTTTGTPLTITECDSYLTPGGILLTADTVLIDVAAGANGCPESTTINFVLQGNANTGSASMTECDTLVFGDSTWTTSGTYEYTLTNVDGCDSVVTINLLINTGDENATMLPENITFCDSVEYGGVWFFADTAIINTVMIPGGAANTCDRYETTTMNLTLDPNNAVATTQTISQCGNYTAGDGTVLDSTITHIFTTTSILTGCDSIVTVNYTNDYIVDSMAIDILSCDDWTSPGGTSIAVSGQVIDTVDTGVGCHVRNIYNVTINSGTNDTVFWSPSAVCDSYTDPNDPSATAYSTVGPHMYTIEAPALNQNTGVANAAPGCDQIVILTLTVTGNADAGSSSVNACDNYTWGSHPTVFVDTILETTYTNGSGCDSVHTLTVNIGSVHTQQFEDVPACTDWSYTDQAGNTQTITWVSGAVVAYNDYWTAANGCDSVVTTTVTFNVGGVTSGSQNVYGCTSYTYGDSTYTASTTVTETLTNASGCDSVLSTNIILATSANGGITPIQNVTDTYCNSYTDAAGNVYTQDTVIVDFWTNMYGCDSTVTVTMTIVNTIVDDAFTFCGDTFYLPGSGDTVTMSGVYTDETLNAGAVLGSTDCADYTITNWTITFGATEEDYSDQSCDNAYIWDGGTHTTAGTYSHTYSSVAGCDSVVNLVLTFGTPSPINIVNETVTGSWTDPNGVVFESDTNLTYSFTNADGCDSTVVVNLTVNEIVGVNETLSNVNVYPNPTNGNVTIELGDLTNVSVKVTNLIGEVIYEDHKISNSTYNLYIEEAAGLYFVEISNENNKEVIKLLVE